MASRILLGLLLALSSSFAFSQSVHQSFCSADKQSPANINGFACKSIKSVTANDFFFSGLDKPKKFNKYGSAGVTLSANKIPGLNSVGISIVQAVYEPNGMFPPHINHVTEVFTVLEGTMEVGFVTGYPDERLLKKVLQKGDAFVFPKGLIHYQKNVGTGNATALFALSGQNIAPVVVGNTLFGSDPEIPSDVLERAFQVDKGVIDEIKTKFV